MNIQIVKYQDNVIDGMLVLNQALPGPDLSHNILFHFDCYANKKLLSTRDFYVVPLPELNLSISDGSFPLDNDQSATITAIVDNPCGFGFKWLVDNLPSWLNVSYSQWGDEVVLSNLNTNFNDFMPFISKLHCHYGIYSSAEIDISCLNTHGKTFVPLDNFNINTQGIITGFKTGSQEITQTLLVIPTKVSDIDVSGIDANAFTGTKMINIKQLIFNDNSSIGTIGQSSFDGDPLESIYFSSSINSIASNAFANCTSLNTLEFTTNSPPNFGSNCFQNDTAITSIWIPKGSTNNYLPYLNIFGGATNPGILKERSI